MMQVHPERSEVFYDLNLYEVADFVIISSAVRSRYQKDPARFSRQIAFYDSLEISFHKVWEIIPEGMAGPSLWIYKNPKHSVQFAGRKTVQGPPPLRHSLKSLSGSEELYYINIGRNYEVYRFYKEALASYDLAFKYPILRLGVYYSLVKGKTRCLLALEKPEEAAEFLKQAATSARSERSREFFLNLRQQILSKISSKN
jgi:hypothetical protein